MSLPFAFTDLPAEVFPFDIEFWRGRELLQKIHVSGPGALRVPKLGTPEDPVMVRAVFADGTVLGASPMKCPGCDVVLDEDDVVCQAAHMEKCHPEIVEERRAEAARWNGWEDG